MIVELKVTKYANKPHVFNLYRTIHSYLLVQFVNDMYRPFNKHENKTQNEGNLAIHFQRFFV